MTTPSGPYVAPAAPPTGTAGGGLAGTYPNPTVAAPLALSQAAAAGGILTVTNTMSGPTAPSTELIANANADAVLGIQVTGDTNQRLQALGGGALKWGSGAAGPDVTVNRISAGVWGVTTGDFDVSTVGHGLRVAEGANGKQGTFALSGAATTVVANTAVTANSRIFLQTQALGTVTVASTLAVSARSAGVSFTVTPSQSTDTSTIAFEIFEPG